MYEPVSELDYFRTLVADPARTPLFEAAASIAQDEHPGLDLQSVLSNIDALGQVLAERCRDASTELKRLQTTTTFFYRELGFSGNVDGYYDPQNSYLHKVLETRRGIPITLALIYIELAGIVGLNAEGIGFPGHFLIKVNLHEGPVVLDPFTGISLSKEDIVERLGPFSKSLGLDSETAIPIAKFLRAASTQEILLRMLRNLREIFRQQGQPQKLKRVLERTLILDPADQAAARLIERLSQSGT